MDHTVTHLLRVYGNVQGVGFRHYVYTHVKRKPVTGWIRNCNDGTVEVMLQGNPTDVGSVEAVCRKGPPAADVENVECFPVDPDVRYDSFEVRH